MESIVEPHWRFSFLPWQFDTALVVFQAAPVREISSWPAPDGTKLTIACPYLRKTSHPE